MAELAKEKKAFLLTGPLPQPTIAFASMRKWAVDLFKMFNLGYSTRGRARAEMQSDFDTTTLGGHVSFDAFAQVLAIRIEDASPSLMK